MDSPRKAETASSTTRAIRHGLMSLTRRMRIERTGQPLSPSKLTAMGWLSRKGPMTPTDLAMLERIRPQSLTRTLAALEEEGLVRRQPGSDDRRQSFVALTDKGHAALDSDMRQRDAWLDAAMDRVLSRTEREMLRLAAQLMMRLADADLEPQEQR
jgi:DNA-binding MarR family transcriptional regulator